MLETLSKSAVGGVVLMDFCYSSCKIHATVLKSPVSLNVNSEALLCHSCLLMIATMCRYAEWID